MDGLRPTHFICGPIRGPVVVAENKLSADPIWGVRRMASSMLPFSPLHGMITERRPWDPLPSTPILLGLRHLEAEFLGELDHRLPQGVVSIECKPVMTAHSRPQCGQCGLHISRFTDIREQNIVKEVLRRVVLRERNCVLMVERLPTGGRFGTRRLNMDLPGAITCLSS
jgi:hypothetical protein